MGDTSSTTIPQQYWRPTKHKTLRTFEERKGL